MTIPMHLNLMIMISSCHAKKYDYGVIVNNEETFIDFDESFDTTKYFIELVNGENLMLQRKEVLLLFIYIQQIIGYFKLY